MGIWTPIQRIDNYEKKTTPIQHMNAQRTYKGKNSEQKTIKVFNSNQTHVLKSSF